MRATSARAQQASPTRLLEILTDRFGAFEAIASSSIALARVAPDEERPMEPLVAEAVLEFGEDLRRHGSRGEVVRSAGTALIQPRHPAP